MNRSRPVSLALVSLVLVAGMGPAMRSSAQEAKPAAAASAPKPAAKPAGAPDEPNSPPPGPAGMVRFPGGKCRIGIDRKDMMEFIAGTDLGRMSNVKILIENEYSLTCPEHVATLPPYWVGIYEITNAQWHRFLETAAKVTYTVPAEGKPGARTLDEISKSFLIARKFNRAGGGVAHPVAVTWRGLYDLNEAVLNPTVDAAGNPLDPALRPKPEAFQNTPLKGGTRLTAYRWTVPLHWAVDGKLRATVPEGRENQPVTEVSLADCMAFAEYYGRHILTEFEWEAAARGPKGEIFPEGKWNPLGHAWKFFNSELEKKKGEAKKLLPDKKRKLEEAEKGGNASSIAAARAVVDELQWVLNAKELPDFTSITTPPVVEVGMFPYGRSPCGAHDLLGNAEEWTSTPLFPYPGTDSQSTWLGFRAQVLRGGNALDKEALIVSVFRKFLAENSPIHMTYKNKVAGFRVGRYETPGASAAVRAVMKIRASEPAILPRETDPKSHLEFGPDLDSYSAVGVERLDDAAWDSSLAPQSDPAGKIFFVGPSRSVSITPATGMPFKDAGGIRKAAEDAAPPAHGKRVSDKRQPRDVPFFGLLYISDGMEVKGMVQTEVTKKVPLTAEETAAWIAAWKARKAAEEQAKKDAEKKDEEKGGDGNKDDGGGSPPPDNKMFAGDGKGDKGKKGDKDDKGKKGDKPADKPKEEPKKEEPAPADPAAADEGADEEEEDKMVVPTEKEVKELELRPGFVKGRDYPDGLLLGFQKHGGELRPVLWEARPGVVGSTASGGIVLLEPPLVVLEEKDLEFKRVGKAMSPFSTFEDKATGLVKLVFFVPVEDGKGAAIEVSLKLRLGDFPAETATSPWLTQAIR